MLRLKFYLIFVLEKIAYFLNLFYIFILPPEQILKITERMYKNDIMRWTNKDYVSIGLFDHEENFINKYSARKGKALVLCCGGGRESIALAKLGLEVVGMDILPAMVKLAKKNAYDFNVKVNFVVQHIKKLGFRTESFDYAICFYYIYGAIPGLFTRIQFLNQIYESLKPQGIFIFNFLVKNKNTIYDKTKFMIGKIIAYLSLGNLQYQFGDEIRYQGEFYHYFQGKKEILSEIRHTKFKIKEIDIQNNYGYAVLNK